MAELHGKLRHRPVLIGGEMALGRDDPYPLGVLADMLEQPLREAGSILLIGPTAATLVELCPTATVLVRRLADGRHLAERGVRVLVGGLDRLPPDEVASLVIQLDPPGRVLTPDSPGCSHVELVRLAAGHVAPGGRLVALVPGPLGLESTPAAPAPDSDDAWWTGTDGYDEKPPELGELPWQPTYFVLTTHGTPSLVATMGAGALPEVADAWLFDRADRAAPSPAVWRRAVGHDATCRATRQPDPTQQRIAELTSALRDRDAQLRGLRDLCERQLRRERALEHAMATEHGPLAHRALFVMTVPMSRMVEAVRARLRR